MNKVNKHKFIYNPPKAQSWKNLGFNNNLERIEVAEARAKSKKELMEWQEHSVKMNILQLQQENELIKKKRYQDITDSTSLKSTSGVQQLVDVIVATRDRRLKAVEKIATAYTTINFLSDYEIVKCIHPKLGKKNFKYKEYKDETITRIKTLRKYCKKIGYFLNRVKVPELGYELKQLR